MRKLLTAAAVALLPGALVCACGGSSSSGFPTMGMPGVPSSALVGSNLVFVDAALNGHPGGRMLVDSGSPVTFIDPAAFPGATLPPATQTQIDLGIGALTIDNVPALEASTYTMDGLNLGGILGGNVLRQFSSAFDYRDRQLRLGDGAAPADVEQPGASVPFHLQGGGVAKILGVTTLVPATRIPVTVTIEGADHPFMLDTGASEVTLRSSLFASLTADGRAVLGGIEISTAYGTTTGQVCRARSVVVGGEEVTNPPVMTIGDSLLDGLEPEVGHPFDGLLGGSFLREFFVTIDYPRGTLHLQRYATRDHIVDEFQRAGIALGPDPTGNHRYVIATVYAGSDAQAKGLAPGFQVVAIDGQMLDNLDPLTADALLDGVVGTTKQIALGQASVALPSGSIAPVRVDDLVPIPPPAN
jgi:hypothetical protein